SPTGATLVSGGVNQNSEDGEGVPEGEFKVWDTEAGVELHALMGHAAAITGLAFTPDGTRLASSSEDLTIKLWDPALGQEVLTLRGGTQPTEAITFSPDGLTLAAVSLDQMIRLWSAAAMP
ncbi:MAG: WD40 repeat domain-containing protein, partial [Acetobacteraceae bacterium]